jgi:hypothetical protein
LLKKNSGCKPYTLADFADSLKVLGVALKDPAQTNPNLATTGAPALTGGKSQTLTKRKKVSVKTVLLPKSALREGKTLTFRIRLSPSEENSFLITVLIIVYVERIAK